MKSNDAFRRLSRSSSHDAIAGNKIAKYLNSKDVSTSLRLAERLSNDLRPQLDLVPMVDVEWRWEQGGNRC